MKKLCLLVLFLIPGISLFASGHGLNGLGVVVWIFGILVFIIIASLLSLGIVNAINARRPNRSRTIMCAFFLAAFTIVYLYYFWHMLADHREAANYAMACPGDQPEYIREASRREEAKIPGWDLMILLIYVLYFIANSIFLSIAFWKLKKGNT